MASASTLVPLLNLECASPSERHCTGTSNLGFHAGRNAFEGYVPSVPEGEKLDFGSKEFREFEDIGKSASHMTPMLSPPSLHKL